MRGPITPRFDSFNRRVSSLLCLPTPHHLLTMASTVSQRSTRDSTGALAKALSLQHGPITSDVQRAAQGLEAAILQTQVRKSATCFLLTHRATCKPWYSLTLQKLRGRSETLINCRKQWLYPRSTSTRSKRTLMPTNRRYDVTGSAACSNIRMCLKCLIFST